MTETIVIKIGGNALKQMNSKFFHKLHQLQEEGIQIVLVHGGGPMISKTCSKLGLTVVKKAGIRVTDRQIMSVTKKLITSEIQPQVLTMLQAQGLDAVAMNTTEQTMIQGDYLNRATYGYVGMPTKLSKKARQYLQAGKIIVFGPLCQTSQKIWLNVNADSLASFVAQALQAHRFVLMTDVPGILCNGHVLPNIHYRQMQAFVKSGVLTSGMVPKLTAAYKALSAGVDQVEILGDLNRRGTLVLP